VAACALCAVFFPVFFLKACVCLCLCALFIYIYIYVHLCICICIDIDIYSLFVVCFVFPLWMKLGI
jgi:hypothetical protein